MLAELIKSSGETQLAWARRIGCSPAYLSDLLSGNSIPSLRLAAKIERLTGGAVMAASWVPVEKEDAA